MQIICLWSWPRIFITVRDSEGSCALELPCGTSCPSPFMPAWGVYAPEAFSFTDLKVMVFQPCLSLSHLSCCFFPHLMPLAECWQEPDERIPAFQYRCWVSTWIYVPVFEYVWRWVCLTLCEHLCSFYTSPVILSSILKEQPTTSNLDWL